MTIQNTNQDNNSNIKLAINNIDAFIFDFDGVLTNNKVFVNQDGIEMVACNRSDGIAFDVLKKIKKPAYIISSEKNSVVRARANKLDIQVIHGVSNKLQSLRSLAKNNNYDLSKIIFVGNDVNDYGVMQACGYSACPSDSHKKIKSISSIVLESKGGDGVVRELMEEVLGMDFIEILYS